MNSESRVMPLEGIEPGLELAEDLVNGAGQLLVNKGAKLTDKLCESLKNRGVEEVCVQVVNPAPGLEEIQSRLDKQFCHTEKTETMIAFKAMLERFHTREDR
ncbi:hypothetical protein [Motiliproteus sp. MSK22-1]|uniref:hypothetical protein n=1 Tax=Motiliproteus sp. MSK22-1 TaxID=1897630 RepID=UPI0009774068|nr:hypothetical protein [Motiliproteus sp. MSK22-1]OMH25894.1 hypothetical protein BGP75_25625 [Motiliproteus sp. MSK22-1]